MQQGSSYFNVDYAPLNALKEKLSRSNGKTDSLLAPTAKHYVTANETYEKELSIKSISEVKIPVRKDVNSHYECSFLQINLKCLTLIYLKIYQATH